MISGASYPIDRDSIAVGYCIWKILLQKVRVAQLPLPHAKKILPVVITMWNRAKGRIDEMTRHLDSILLDFPKGTPKQRLVIREIMKLALSVYFAKRHGFPSKTVPKGQGYTKIQSHLWHLGKGFTVRRYSTNWQQHIPCGTKYWGKNWDRRCLALRTVTMT